MKIDCCCEEMEKQLGPDSFHLISLDAKATEEKPAILSIQSDGEMVGQERSVPIDFCPFCGKQLNRFTFNTVIWKRATTDCFGIFLEIA